MSGQSLDDFLKEPAPTYGKGKYGNQMRSWRKRGSATVWLHTTSMFHKINQHSWPRYFEDRKSGVRKVWGGEWNCWEDNKMNFYEADDGSLKHPPTKCPFCKVLDQVRIAVNTGKLDWLDPVFCFDGDNESKILRAQLMYKTPRDPSPVEIKELQAHDLTLRDMFKYSTLPRTKYAFVVVDNDNPDDGVQIALETSTLGDKMRRLIADKIADVGSDAGNPLKSPYAFQWMYKPKEEIMNKYHARAMSQVQMTEQIEALIRSEPPSFDKVVMPGDAMKLRSIMEETIVEGAKPYIDFDVAFGDMSGDFSAEAPDDEDEIPF